jgi:transcriptional regulator with XRE-family HTH domain
MKILREYMATTGLNQSQLAERIGVSRSAVTLWLQKMRQPSDAQLDIISARTGISRKRLAQENKCGVCGKFNPKHGISAYRCKDCCEAAGRSSSAAGLKVKAAIAAGLLKPIAGQSCADCGKPAFCYDHRDYSKPLDVAPVCRACNWKRGPAIQFIPRQQKRAVKEKKP